MRRLATSLICVVLAATLGAGWALDRLFVEMSPSGPTPLSAYRQLGRSQADLISRLKEESVAAGESDEVTEPDDIPGRGTMIVPRDTFAADPDLQMALESETGLALESATGVTLYYALTSGDSLLAVDYPVVAEPLPRLRLVLTIAFYVALVLLTLAWLLPLLRRLARVSEASRAFGAGDLARRVPIGSAGELRDVETAFNAMTERIENLVEDNRLLSRAVSHDLKTPLARLRFGVDSLGERDDLNDTQKVQLARIDSDVASMERLVSVLLDFARFDSRLASQRLSAVDLDAVVRDALARTCVANEVASTGATAQADEQQSVEPKIDWRQCGAESTVSGHAALLAMLLDNLFTNAVRHARSRVRVTRSSLNHDVELAVEDDGDGIDAADRERVIRPFERADRGRREEDHPGHGLGLAIVARIVSWHRGTLHIDESPDLGGARVRISLPPLV